MNHKLSLRSIRFWLEPISIIWAGNSQTIQIINITKHLLNVVIPTGNVLASHYRWAKAVKMTLSRCKRAWLVHVKQTERERHTFIDFREKGTRERETWGSVTMLTDWFSLSDINERLSSDCLSCKHTTKTLRAVRKNKLSNPPKISELMHQTPDSQEVPGARPQSRSLKCLDPERLMWVKNISSLQSFIYTSLIVTKMFYFTAKFRCHVFIECIGTYIEKTNHITLIRVSRGKIWRRKKYAH